MPARRKYRNREHYTRHNRVRLLRGGKPYFDCLLDIIGNAKDTIHFQTYIFADDETGQLVANALAGAVRRGVKVYLLADGYASNAMSKEFRQKLKDAGINFRFFSPLFKSNNFYFGRRLHHKIVVADSRYSLVGGINITDRYNDMPEIPAWLDFALYTEGEAAIDLCMTCWQNWRTYPAKIEPASCEAKEPLPLIPAAEESEVAIRRNDWVRARNEISATYVNMFRHAKSHIVILCSYFLPGRIIRRQLSYASKNGVKITVITAGISDVKLAKYAERYLYGWMLRKNIEVYEYQKAVLHGKIAVCDDEWMTIGSYNINNISAYASIELNMNVRNEKLARETAKTLMQIAEKDCVYVSKEYYARSKNAFKQFVRWFSFEIIRLIFYLFTFYFKRRRVKEG